MALNNNQVATVINQAVALSTGKPLKTSTGVDIVQLNLQNVIDAVHTYDSDTDILGTKESFTQALLNVIIKNWFTDTSYRGQYKDHFFVDSEEFGAIVQSIHMEYPSAQTSHAWNDFAPSSDGTRKTVGTYDVYVPVIHTQIYGKTVSWEIPISITDEQWDTAFRDASELSAFVNYVYMMVDNAIVMHLEEMDNMNRNNFIAEKLLYSRSKGAEGVHVINLIQLYHDETGSTLKTPTAFLKDEGAVRWMASQFSLYSDYMKKMSKNFNTAGFDRFTPVDRQVFLLNSNVDKRIRSVALATTFNPQYLDLKNYDTVPYWQATGSYAFADVTKININSAEVFTIPGAKDTDPGTQTRVETRSGIIGILVDKYAIMHTIKKRRVAVKRFEPEALTTTFNQFRDHYSNDLTQNAIVFTLETIS